ncbi:MAG: DUF2231 domain-containing protein [Deltaproteobacteria bacterium]|nr:DUF2231 domain-containing protein [Deltaproteobacteria bacterium]
MQEFDLQTLAENNGQDGKKIFIAHEGKIYDVSASKMWKGGLHMRRHPAGTDLTTDIQAAPHGAEVLERYPQVGVVKKAEAAAERKVPRPVAWLLETNPFFRRHPHPMTVHFPIVFFLANPFFNVLYVITGNASFETTALHCLAGGILFGAIAIVTGLFTWWYNYMARMMKPIAVKIPLSLALLVVAATLFFWRLNDPDIMAGIDGGSWLYLVLSLALFPIVSIVGWYGATMTFPIEKK